MEKTINNRLLGYQLSTLVPMEEWQNIVGGNKEKRKICAKMTHTLSHPIGSPDFIADRIID